MALSLYTKYRPQAFKEVVGQEHIEKTLANAVEKNKVSHAYLFCGPRGTGKTTTARILAKALLCDKAPTAAPDGTCEHCREISEGVHPDVYELDAASRTGVENVREEIIGRVSFAPTLGSHKIYIIDEVHMLSTAAFNALLKTLEEPPSHVVFVLCTTDVHKVPDTVQARCQRFDFKHLSLSEIVGRLQYISEREGFDSEPAALELIAQRAQGGMRDAIRSLEQTAVFSGGAVSYTAAESLLGMVDAEQLFVLCDSVAAGDAAACFDWVAGYVQSGSDIAILVNDLAAHVRNLYAVSVSSGSDEHLISALGIASSALPRLRDQAARFGTPDRLAWMLTVLGSLSAELKSAANARLALEVALTRILRPESEASLAALLVRVTELERRLAGMGASGALSAAGSQTIVSSGVGSQAAGSQAGEPGAAGLQAVGSSAVGPSANGSHPVGFQAVEPSASGPQEAGASPSGTQAVASSADGRQAAGSSAAASGQEGYGADSGQTSASVIPSQECDLQGEDQALHRQWNSVVDAIKKEKIGVAANLGGATPSLGKEGKRLTIELPAGATTSRQYLETDANKALLNRVVAKVFGEAKEVVLTVATGPSCQGEPVDPMAADPIEEESGQEQAAAAPVEKAAPAAYEVQTELEVAAEADAKTEAGGDTRTEPAPEPSKEELDNILSNSMGSRIQFKEQ